LPAARAEAMGRREDAVALRADSTGAQQRKHDKLVGGPSVAVSYTLRKHEEKVDVARLAGRDVASFWPRRTSFGKDSFNSNFGVWGGRGSSEVAACCRVREG
jgi:hypothetical protein